MGCFFESVENVGSLVSKGFFPVSVRIFGKTTQEPLPIVFISCSHILK